MATKTKVRVMVVEDDPKTASLLRLYLEHAGYEIVVASNGREALRLAGQKPPPALAVLDVMLPHVDGLQVCRELKLGSNAAVILLTARSTEEDRLLGLDLGADDYVTKPFSPRELVARVRAVLRRHAPSADSTGSAERDETCRSPSAGGAGQDGALRAGAIEIDPTRHLVRVGDRVVELTPREFDLLHALARRPGRVFSREDLAAAAFGPDFEASGRTIDAHVKNLRAKIEPDPAAPAFVLTVFGVGYRLAEAEGDA